MTTTLARVVHSSTLIDFDGQIVLTDPWFSEKPGYYHGEALAFTPTTLPPLTAVLASHDHYDHYDLDAFAAYPDKAVPLVVNRGMAAKARRAGFGNVTELDAWDHIDIGDLRITAAPAKHSVPEITFIIEGGEDTVFFGADTLRIPDLDQIATRWPHIDLALLPING
jgi:L-ascorbate metabolism protein UlaG (beta-lactamase superfamily)